VPLKFGLVLLKVIRNSTIRYSIRVPIGIGPILYGFRDEARYWSKIAIFHTPPAFDASGFDTGPDPTRPTQDGEFCDPTRPDLTRPVGGPDPCPTLNC